jgi:hypothetical protein
VSDLPQPGRVHHVRHPDVAVPARATDRARLPATQPDRRPAGPHRAGLQGEVADGGELAVDRHALAGEQGAQHAQALVDPAEPTREVDARGLELGRELPARPHAELEAAAGDSVQVEGELRGQGGGVEGEQRDRADQPDRARRPGRRRQRHEGVRDGAVEEQVLTGGDEVEARGLGRPRLGDGAVEVAEDEPDPHPTRERTPYCSIAIVQVPAIAPDPVR